LVKNPNFSKKIFRLFLDYPNFSKKSKCWLKIKSLGKNPNFTQKSNVLSKDKSISKKIGEAYKFVSKIEIFV